MTRLAKAVRQLAPVVCRQMLPQQVNSGQVSMGVRASATQGFRGGAQGKGFPGVVHTRLLHTSHAVQAEEEKAVAVTAETEDALEELVVQIEEEPSMTPAKVVEKLDKYIVGQSDAKRAVAVALRNRWRRHKVASPLK